MNGKCSNCVHSVRKKDSDFVFCSFYTEYVRLSHSCIYHEYEPLGRIPCYRTQQKFIEIDRKDSLETLRANHPEEYHHALFLFSVTTNRTNTQGQKLKDIF